MRRRGRGVQVSEAGQYDPAKAAAYWSLERLSKARNPLAAVLSFSQPDFVNEAYDLWESSFILESLGGIEGLQVADVACGVGRMTIRLAKKGAKVFAIDIASGMLERTRQASINAKVEDLVEVFLGSATKIPIASYSCDAVVCAGLMEHLPSDARAACIAEIARILKPGGRLALVVNNAKSEYLRPSVDNPYRVGVQLDTGYFCQLVDPDEVERLLDWQGFDVKRIAANLHYSHVRHLLQNQPERREEGASLMANALERDLSEPLHPGEDERYADHFVLGCRLRQV